MADRGRRSRTGAPPHDFNIRTTIGAEDPDVNHHAPPLSGHHIEHASTSAQSTSHFYQPLYSHQAMDARSTSGAGVGDPNYYASSQQSNVSYPHNVNPSAPLQPGHYVEQASTSAQSTAYFNQQRYLSQARDARATSGAGVGDPNYYASSQQSNISYPHNVNPSAPLQPGHHIEHASTSAQSTSHFYQPLYSHQAMDARSTSGAGVGDPNYYASSQQSNISYPHNVNPSAPLQPGHYVKQASTSAQSTGYFHQQRYLSQAMDARATSGAGVGDPNYHASSQAGQILYQAQPRYQYQPAYRHVDPAASGLQAPPTASFVPLLSIGHNVAPRVLEPQYYVAPPHPPTQAPGPAIMNPGFDMSTRPGRLLNQAGRGQLAHYGPRVRQQVGTAGPPEQQLAFQRPPSRPPSRGQRGGKSRGGQQRPDPAIQSATQGQTLRGQSRSFPAHPAADVASSSIPVHSSALNPQARPFSPSSRGSSSGSTNSPRQELTSPASSCKSAESTRIIRSAGGARGSRTTGAADVADSFPRRPGSGLEGEPVTVEANFFHVTLRENLTLYHYDVDITKTCSPVPAAYAGAHAGADAGAGPSGDMKPPSRLSKRCKSLVFCEFRKQYESIVVVFDGEKNMYTTQALPITDELSSVVSLPRPGGRSGSDQFLILVRKVAELKSNDQQAMVQALDIAIRQACSRGRQTIGRLLFEQVQCDQRLDPGIVIGEGLFTSLRIGEAGAFINVDVVRAAFYNEAEDLALLAKHLLFKDRVRPERVQSLNERQVENVRGFFCGMPICVKHLTYRPKMTVVHVTEETAEEKQFDYGNESITVANYFNRKYKPQLAYPKLPCIDVGGNCYYPMEKCFPIKFGKCVQILKEFTLDKGTREYMLMTPQVKLGTAKNAVNQKMDKSLLQSFFKDLPESPYELKARRLTDFPTETGSTVPLTVQYWVIANACKNAPLACNQLNIFRDTLVNEGKKLNVHLSEHWDSRDFSQSNPRSMLEDLSRKSRRPDIVFVILDKNSPRYNSIKYYAETKFGFITQCVTKANFCKSQQQLVSVLSNVMRKVKAKMGGAEKVMKGGVGAFRFDHVMVMGADVSHPGPKEKGKPSVAAIVASIDERASRYVATFRVQAQDPATRRRVEIIQDMENVAKDLLRTYKEETGAEPEKIIFYRDGVSEGQFSQVQQSELRALRAACDDVLQERPAITLLTVQKRHRTRFVRRREHLNVEQGTVVDTGHGTRFVRREHLNVEQGTVVDTGITHPRDFDFYLCSHHSPLGTARPAHYYVLWDEIGFTSDELQLLTYGLCNVYARCKTAVSIPAPVYYAHHAATRASCYLQVEGQAHGNTFRLSQHVKSKMFFI